MGSRDKHVPDSIKVHCIIKGRNLKDGQIRKLEKSIEHCPVKRILLKGAAGTRSAGEKDQFIQTEVKYEEML